MATVNQPVSSNGINGKAMEDAASHQVRGGDTILKDMSDRLSQLPPEIVHITQGYLPLSQLLTRLAQQTHNNLSSKIVELAQMPMPVSVVNGNSVHYTALDDNSADNIKKKKILLDFAQKAHADWTKALVLTSWSRKSEDVSRIIDLKVHLDKQRLFYDAAVHEMSEVKRNLAHARLPNPDLKTALEVLSTGKAAWMPEV
jgi:mediator of RNA polymerase II transcription subunit 14